MKIYREVKTNLITQTFGQNFNNFYAQLGMKGHNGIDFFAVSGEPVYYGCTTPGEVVAVYNDDPVNEGIGVDIRSVGSEGIFQHRYWHLKEVKCKLGAIKMGDIIGLADNTGRYTTGTHLHRDLKPMILKDGNFVNKEQNNGYFGAVDIAPYFVNTFVLDVIGQINILQKLIDFYYQMMKLLKRSQ